MSLKHMVQGQQEPPKWKFLAVAINGDTLELPR